MNRRNHRRRSTSRPWIATAVLALALLPFGTATLEAVPLEPGRELESLEPGGGLTPLELASLVPPRRAAPAYGATAPIVEPEVLSALAADGRADVVVLLADGVRPEAPDGIMLQAAAAAQADVLADLAPGDFEVSSRPRMLPILSGSVTVAGLTALRSHPRVVAVEAQELYQPLLVEAVPAVKADIVHNVYGLTGRGVTVAVLDTGIDNSHPDFEGRIVDQHCYAKNTRSCEPSGTGESTSAQDEYGHGTAVSGIILSSGAVSSPGVAPEADLVAVRVFRDTGGAATEDIINGLDFVLRRQVVHDIRIVNMSLGGGAGRGVNCDDQNAAMKQAFQRLVARQVAIFVATGNGGSSDSVASPACISNSIAVGATYDVEAANGGGFCPQQTNVTPLTIACFTDRGRAMDLLAPGLFIASSRLGGGVTSPGAGTSYAAPMAAGVAALILQANEKLRPAELEQLLRRTGTPVKHLEDPGFEIPLVNALAAIQSIVPNTPAASATPTQVPPTATPTASATATPGPATLTPTAPDTPTPGGPTPVVPTATTAPTSSLEPGDGFRIYLPVAKRRY